jgi:multidrug efflux system membrane fusion protein
MQTTRIAPWIALALTFGTLAACGSGDAGNRKAQPPPVPVTVAAVTERAVPVTVSAAGVVESTASVTVVSRVDGPIVKVFVTDGQDVKAGEPILQIDPEPLRIKVRAAEATVARDKALLADAVSKEARGKAMLEQHYLSKEEYLQLQSSLDSAASTVKADEAQLDQARLELGYSTVRAPVAGKIGHIALQLGNTVHAASAEPLTTLMALDTVDVSFAVPEQYLTAIRRALEAGTATVAVPPSDGEGEDLSGKVTFIDNSIDRASGTIRLRARFENKAHVLWPGQFVTASLALATSASAIVVPAVAVSEGPQGSYVYVVGNDLAVELRNVKVARVAGDDALVSGVKPGERVVIDGQSRLVPGARVRIREPQPAAA